MYKINFLKLSVIFLILAVSIFAQDEIISGLDNPDPSVRINTLYKIQKEKLVQYDSALQVRMFNQNKPYLVNEYLVTLEAINSGNLESIALQLITFSDNFSEDEIFDNPLQTKVYATSVLCRLHNYSTIHYAFELLDRDFPRISADAVYVIIMALDSVPEYYEQAKSQLLRIVHNAEEEDYRLSAISALEDKLGSEAFDLLVDRFQNDPEFSIRSVLLMDLAKLNYPDLNSLLKNRLPVEPRPSVRLQIADTLLNRFGKPSDMKTVINYQPTEPNEDVKLTLGFHIQDFKPPIPDSTITTLQMVQNLLEFADSLYSYGWIPADSTYNSYKAELTVIKNAVENGDTSTATMIENELSKVEADYGSEIITRDAYLFLHYPLVYIKNRLE